MLERALCRHPEKLGGILPVVRTKSVHQLLRRPDVVAAFNALAVGVEGRSEPAVRRSEVPYQEVRGLQGHPASQGPYRRIVALAPQV